MYKRGQAALEFLTTYGWAFLVILIMIGALGYFGVLNPDRFLPQRCNVGPEFNCLEFQATVTDGVARIIFANNVGQTLAQANITGARTDGEDITPVISGGGLGDTTLSSVGDCSVTNLDGATPGSSVVAGQRLELACVFTDTLWPPSGAKKKFNFDITYLPLGRSYTQPLNAEIFVTVQ